MRLGHGSQPTPCPCPRRIVERTSATPLPNRPARLLPKTPSPGPGSGATPPTSTTCSRGTISDAQADAGLRFARDFRQSGMPRGQLVARYEHVPRLRKYQPPPDTPDAVEARERFEAAQAALGPLLGITFHVAVCDAPASERGASATNRNGDAVGLLRFALATLVQHYAARSCPVVSRSPMAWSASAEPPPPPDLHNSGFVTDAR